VERKTKRGKPPNSEVVVVSIDPILEGRWYPPTRPYTVERAKIAEFARAVFAESEYHFDVSIARAAGYRDVLAPTTFPSVIERLALNLLLADSSTGLEFSRVVHGDQRFTYARPVVAGDLLSGRLKVTKVRELGGNSLLTATTSISDAHLEHVVSATSTLVVRAD
jgi:acyl dehydratase